MVWNRDTVNTYPLPPGYAIRPLEKGEEELWCECIIGDMGVNEVSAGQFNERVGDDPDVGEGNVLVIADADGVPAATACVQTQDGEPWLHLVSVKQSERGKGLGKPICAAVIQKHLDEGRPGCYLVTQDFRKAAVKMYLEMGFLPVMDHPSYKERYAALAKELGIEKITGIDENGEFVDVLRVGN